MRAHRIVLLPSRSTRHNVGATHRPVHIEHAAAHERVPSTGFSHFARVDRLTSGGSRSDARRSISPLPAAAGAAAGPLERSTAALRIGNRLSSTFSANHAKQVHSAKSGGQSKKWMLCPLFRPGVSTPPRASATKAGALFSAPSKSSAPLVNLQKERLRLSLRSPVAEWIRLANPKSGFSGLHFLDFAS